MTASWMSGYVADVAYTLGFYREIAPTFIHFACIVNGVDGPNPDHALRYAEFGCGRGYGTTLLAAANPNIEFVGVDFNPSHIAEARRLAEQAKIPNVTFFEMSFSEAAQSSDPALSNFDIVAMHGVYTWVERSVRADIHRFVGDKLLAGGLLYNSYNVLPGWAPIGPVQHLVKEVARRSSRDSVSVMEESQALLKSLVDNSSVFIAQNPGVKSRIERMAKQDRTYLAHEFVNAGWEPMYVTDVMRNFAETKLTYVGSACLPENRLDLCAPRELHATISAAPDVGMRELLKDYAINKHFRRDLYIKGPQQLSAREQRQRLGAMPFASALLTKQWPDKVQVPLGELSLRKEAVEAVMATLADDGATGQAIIAAAEQRGIPYSEVMFVIMLLVNSGAISPGRSPARPDGPDGAARRLNSVVMEHAVSADSHRFMASPVLGSAIPVSFVDRIFGLEAFGSGSANEIEAARRAFDRLEAKGQTFRREGKPIAKTQDEILKIAELFKEFRSHRVPRWRALGLQ
jgi:SAM-dependent methyltransferase